MNLILGEIQVVRTVILKTRTAQHHHANSQHIRFVNVTHICLNVGEHLAENAAELLSEIAHSRIGLYKDVHICRHGCSFFMNLA